MSESRQWWENFLRGKIIIWGEPARKLLYEGSSMIQLVKSADSTGLVSVLLYGPANSGKTTTAVNIARSADFPYIKVISPEVMVGCTESQKCTKLKKAFDDSYKSPLSVLLIDNLERLFDYCPIGPTYSNLILQTLLVLLKKQPPPGKKLLILATTSSMEVMDKFDVSLAFTSSLEVHQLKSGEDILNALKQTDSFTPKELIKLQTELSNKRCAIGIKKLVDIANFAKQTCEAERISTFLTQLDLYLDGKADRKTNVK